MCNLLVHGKCLLTVFQDLYIKPWPKGSFTEEFDFFQNSF